IRTRIPRANACRIAGTDNTRRYGSSGIQSGCHISPSAANGLFRERSPCPLPSPATEAEVTWQKLIAFLDSFRIAWFGGPMTPEEQLRKVSLRVTRPRVAVLTEVKAHPHADVDTLTAKVRARLGSVSTQAVYDVLRALADAELIRRIQPAGSPARFESRAVSYTH